MKKLMLVVATAILSLSVINPVFADADDNAWILKCISDNKDQNQSSEVIESYCRCMNGKMSSDETQSVTTWEKTHKAETDMCSKQAGWK